MNPTDPDARAAFITGLYQLADYLAENPGIPVPAVRHHHPGALDEQEDGSRAEIDYVAAEYLWPVHDEDGCYETYRDFGPVGYTGLRPHQSPHGPALAPRSSYWGSVTPDAVASDA